MISTIRVRRIAKIVATTSWFLLLRMMLQRFSFSREARHLEKVGPQELRKSPFPVVSGKNLGAGMEWAEKAFLERFIIDDRDKEKVVAEMKRRFADEGASTIEAANRFARGEFSLLGSGNLRLPLPLPWHRDFVNDHEFPVVPSGLLPYRVTDDSKSFDIKIPWELSRCHHFITFGQAYWLTGEERYTAAFRDHIIDWIEKNPAGFGVNWRNTMEVAIRAMNWATSYAFFRSSKHLNTTDRATILGSLYQHGSHISRHLELSPISGNHYFSDCVGLLFVGAIFDTTEHGKRWYLAAKKEIYKEMQKQFLKDGVDHELSIGYHRLVLELSLLAVSLLQRRDEIIPSKIYTKLKKACAFTASMTRSDGTVPQIGDADDGRALIFSEGSRKNINDHRYLLSLGSVLLRDRFITTSKNKEWPERAWLCPDTKASPADRSRDIPEVQPFAAFPSGGFYVLRSCDVEITAHCADVGFRGMGVHSHNDQLGFEYMRKGEPLFVDPGTFVYTSDPKERNMFRGTAAHNTIMIDNAEINRFQGDDIFSLSNDTKPLQPISLVTDTAVLLRLGHTGYRRLPQPVTVQRTFVLHRETGLILIVDRLQGKGRHAVKFFYHCAASVHASLQSNSSLLLQMKNGETVMVHYRADVLRAEIRDDWVSPSYGIRNRSTTVVMSGDFRLPSLLATSFAPGDLDQNQRETISRDLSLLETSIPRPSGSNFFLDTKNSPDDKEGSQ